MRPLLLAVLAAGLLPAAAAAASWSGTWANDEVGTRGSARLSEGRHPALRLDGAALGCAEPVSLAVTLERGRVSGRGRNLPCNHGLRWTVSGPAARPVIRIRLPDGSAALLRLDLRRRR